MTDRPEAREMDLLLSTGEIVTSTLLSMALKHDGHPAVALSGAQAGIGTDKRYGRARILKVDPVRRPSRARRRQHRHRRRLPGRHRGAGGHDARPRRLRHDGRRARRGAEGSLRDLHRRRGHLLRRPAHRAGRTQVPGDQLRRDAGAGHLGRASHAQPRGGAGRGLQRADLRRLQLQRRARHTHTRRSVHGTGKQGSRHRQRHRRRAHHGPRRPRPARHRRHDLRAAGRGGHQRRHDRPERQRRAPDRPHFHRPALRACRRRSIS